MHANRSSLASATKRPASISAHINPPDFPKPPKLSVGTRALLPNSRTIKRPGVSSNERESHGAGTYMQMPGRGAYTDRTIRAAESPGESTYALHSRAYVYIGT